MGGQDGRARRGITHDATRRGAAVSQRLRERWGDRARPPEGLVLTAKGAAGPLQNAIGMEARRAETGTAGLRLRQPGPASGAGIARSLRRAAIALDY